MPCASILGTDPAGEPGEPADIARQCAEDIARLLLVVGLGLDKVVVAHRRQDRIVFGQGLGDAGAVDVVDVADMAEALQHGPSVRRGSPS